MHRLLSSYLTGFIVLILSVSLVLSFPVVSFGAENADPYAGEYDPAAVSEGAAGALDQDIAEELPSNEDDFLDPDSESGDFESNTDIEAEDTVNAFEESENPEETAGEDPTEEEIIVVEHEKKTIWANHTYTVKQPKTGLLPIVRWKSSDKSIASVSDAGKITARAIGTATINGFDEKNQLRKVVKVTVKLGRDYTLFVAHRGYRAVAPENTLPAFREAVKAGFGGIELDVWESKTTSKDATPCILVVHDKNLKKKTGKKMKAYKLNRKNRSKYKIRKNVKGLKKYGPQLIPTLAESLDCIYTETKAANVENFVVEIDIKNDMSDRAVKYIIKKVGKHRVHIMSSKQDVLAKFKKYRKYDTTEIWYCNEIKSETKRMSNIKKAGEAGFDGISIPYRFMNKETINIAKSYGMQIGGYNIIQPAYVQKWVKAGCTRFNMNDKIFL